MYHIFGYMFLSIVFILILIWFSFKYKSSEKKLQNKNQELVNELSRCSKTRSEELQLAHRVKERNLAINHNLHGVKVSIKFVSDSEIGGDFFALVPIEKNPDRCRRCIEPCGGSLCHLAKNEGGFIIGDMNLTGLPATLMITQVLGAVEQAAGTVISPSKILKRVNSFISENQKHQEDFCTTAFYGYIDQRKGVLKYAHGGHEPPIYYNKLNKRISLLEADGLVLGTNQNAQFEEKEVYLTKGDKIVMYTPLFNTKESASLLDIVSKYCESDIDVLLDGVEKEINNLNKKDNDLQEDFILVGLEILNTPYGKYTVPAHLSMIGKITEEVVFIAQQQGMRNKGATALRVSLSEILSNAILHGSNKDPNKTIDVEVWLEDRNIKVTVTDSGKGFDYKKLYFDKIPDDLFVEEGRGLFLIKSYVDDMYFGEKGNSITITKSID
ncbi:MAG: hypothetical protein APF76_17315 [Desulfitibacter sp. BRH_c19]|nr:MAG: hypothetical protein APF76_17315 [Desulfitibacter sp. BRH_c19]